VDPFSRDFSWRPLLDLSQAGWKQFKNIKSNREVEVGESPTQTKTLSQKQARCECTHLWSQLHSR
jgi:hypothetical protein